MKTLTCLQSKTEKGYFKCFVILYTVFILSLAVIFILIEKKKTLDDIDAKLDFGSKVIMQILPKDFLEKGTVDPSLNSERFFSMTENMSQTTEKLGFTYLYSLVKNPQTGKYQFSSMTLTKDEWKNEKDRYYYLYEYSDAPAEILDKAIQTMQPQFHEYSDQWGQFRSIFVPHQAPNGQIFITAADYDTTQLKTITFGRIIYISSISLFLISAMIPLLLYIRKHHQKNEIELEKRVQERTEQLLHANRLSELGRLAASVIHEIKNPLAIIMGYTALAKTQDDLDKIYEAAKRIDFVLNGLRTFSRGEKDVKKSSFDAHKNLELVMALWGPLLKKESSINIQSHFRATHSKIFGVPQQFDQAILNFITNARDAINEIRAKNEGKISITTVNPSEHQLVIIIEDNGKGMNEEILKKIATAFYTTKDKEKGTGLGVYISKSIIQEMEGELQFESIENQGSKITITLPCELMPTKE